MPPVATQHQTLATELGSRRTGPTGLAEAVVVADVAGWQRLRLAIQTSSPTQVCESGHPHPREWEYTRQHQLPLELGSGW